MSSEHNPVAVLIHQIQKRWTSEISGRGEIKLTRFLIKPDQARLYEGFLKLESTEHGAIPEALIAMLTPFKGRENYSIDLMNDWIKTFKEDSKTHEKLATKDKTITWDPAVFLIPRPGFNSNPHQELLDMLSSFHHAATENKIPMVVALFPHSVSDMESLRTWLIELLQQEIPDGISFMIFDHIGQYYFDSVFKKYPAITKTIHVDLDLDGAISKIAKMGNPNSPEVKLRECILEMGKCVQNKDRSGVDKWGEKALQATQKSNSKGMYASAHIIYAGMLFNFKQFEKIDSLLLQGLSIAKTGLKTESSACRPLVIQFYGFIGASKQLQKKTRDAIQAYELQGDTATQHQLQGMALTPYCLAYTLSKKAMPERYDDLLTKAYTTGRSMQKEEKLNSSFPNIALDYLQWLEAANRRDEVEQTTKELDNSLGMGWKDIAKQTPAFKTEMKESPILT